jgi:hypothetical protein
VVITSGVGLTGILLAILGYESTLAMFGGSAVATLVWIALCRREAKLGEEDETEPQALAAWQDSGWQNSGDV